MSISVIVPTYNRASSLFTTLQSLSKIGADHEIIIVDNNSTDNTRQIALEFSKSIKHSVKYYFEPTPGLSVARHRGCTEASNDILTFIDDDVIINKGWADCIEEAFSNRNVGMAGGPSFPSYESTPPLWIDYFHHNDDSCSHCSSLSLINQGIQVKETDPTLIWGLNFSIRKELLIMLGGFNPDCYPGTLQYLQGDGESGLAKKFSNSDFSALYHPGIKLEHCINTHRLSLEYFKKRFYYEGICQSFADIRDCKQPLHSYIEDVGKIDTQHLPSLLEIVTHHYNRLRFKVLSLFSPNQKHSYTSERTALQNEIYQAFIYGYIFHQNMVSQYPSLYEWVVVNDYLHAVAPTIGPQSSL